MKKNTLLTIFTHIIKNYFSLNKEKNTFIEALVEMEESETGSTFSKIFRKQFIRILKSKESIGGLALVSASVFGNFLNFLYNSYLGRVLGFEHFALIGLMSGLLSFASIFFGAFSTTANYRSAFLIGKYGNEAGYQFWKYIRKRVLYLSVAITIIWILFIPFLMKFFDVTTPWLFILFGIILLTGLANGADRGLISAKFMFGGLAVINLFDPIIRITTAVLLVNINLKHWAYAAIPLAIFGTFIIGYYWVIKNKDVRKTKNNNKEITYFPFHFFGASLLSGFSSIAFSTFDILLANHFLPPIEAGKYTLLSLVGKMIYFLGGLTSPFIIPLISRIEGARKNSLQTMYVLVISTGLLAFIGFIGFGIIGSFTIPFLYGKKAFAITSFLQMYTFGMLCYTVSKVFVNYYLVRKVYTFTFVTSLLVFLQVTLITFYHKDVASIALVMTVVWVIHLLLTSSLHLVSDKVINWEKKFALKFNAYKIKDRNMLKNIFRS